MTQYSSRLSDHLFFRTGNQMGEDDASEAATEIGGGSIVIHKAK